MNKLQLNLNEVNTDFNIINYPDGQRDIDIQIDENFDNAIIKTPMRSFADLEILLCATSTIRRRGIRDISVYIPYLLGARSDRQFKNTSSSYLTDVIAPVINAQGYTKVFILDPHSAVTTSSIYNVRVIDSPLLEDISEDSILIFPDMGARDRYEDLIFGDDYRIGYCDKKRDLSTGKIISMGLHSVIDTNARYHVIDDLCDGGATFINVAILLQEKGIKKIDLSVTHGVFSKGFEELSKYFENIYTTNSYQSIPETQFGNCKVHCKNVWNLV